MRKWLGAVTDARRRPRTIIVLAMVVMTALGLYAASMYVTSTRWFCNDVCHTVHADNAKQYFASAHAEISCMACHYPPNMDPAKFAIDRVDKLLDIYPTIVGDFEMPLNEHSRIALMMPSEHCTQCHSSERKVTPTRGLIIDHDVHVEAEINCTACHNRGAHALTTPLTLPHNAYPEDFMTMRACFRCHAPAGTTSPSPAYAASGACATCHTASFPLRPADHDSAWMTASGGASPHAKAAEADAEAVEHAREEWAEVREEFLNEQPRILMRLIDVDTERPLDLPPAAAVDGCGMCHDTVSFCDPCHASYEAKDAS